MRASGIGRFREVELISVAYVLLSHALYRLMYAVVLGESIQMNVMKSSPTIAQLIHSTAFVPCVFARYFDVGLTQLTQFAFYFTRSMRSKYQHYSCMNTDACMD